MRDDKEDIKEAFKFIYKLTNVTKEEIRAKTRKRQPVFARQLLSYYLRKNTRMSLHQIGETIDRDHATIIHSVNKITEDAEYDAYVRDMKEAIDGKVAPYIYSLRVKLTESYTETKGIQNKVDDAFRVILNNIELFESHKRSMESKSLYDNALRLQQTEIGLLREQVRDLKSSISSIMK